MTAELHNPHEGATPVRNSNRYRGPSWRPSHAVHSTWSCDLCPWERKQPFQSAKPLRRVRTQQAGLATLLLDLLTEEEHRIDEETAQDEFLEDYARRPRGDVKLRTVRPLAKVSQLFPDKDCGFLVPADGRDIYFHKDSVLNRAFGRLKVGTKVRFAEEEGDKGPQASTVQIVGKQGPYRRPRQTAA